jgi:tRNA pseudouridine32 synthase/23S rRNA pseudouridine746 synthase
MMDRAATNAGLTVIRRGEGYVVVEKPAGVLSVPGIGPEKQDCVIARVRTMAPDASGPMMVHRLDMDTSGLLIVATTPPAQAFLSREFEERRVEKRYTALCDGVVRDDAGIIDLPLRMDVENRPYQIVDAASGKSAVTRYRVLSREVDRTRVLFEPITGRTHQLRVHAAKGLGCPILGDVLYGDEDSAPRLMLHAGWLRFREPVGERWVEVESPTPF